MKLTVARERRGAAVAEQLHGLADLHRAKPGSGTKKRTLMFSGGSSVTTGVPACTHSPAT